jgi:hypothetical protein
MKLKRPYLKIDEYFDRTALQNIDFRKETV